MQTVLLGTLKLIGLAEGSSVGGVLLCEGSDQTQQFLLFWACAATEESNDVLMLHLPTRSHIGFVMDEHTPEGFAIRYQRSPLGLS